MGCRNFLLTATLGRSFGKHKTREDCGCPKFLAAMGFPPNFDAAGKFVLGTPGLARRSPRRFGPGTPKNSEQSLKGCPGVSSPGEPQSPQKVRPGVRKESKVSPNCVFGLFSDSGAHSLGTLSYFFGVP